MSGTVQTRTPPGRSTLAHSASTAPGSGTYSSTLALVLEHARADHRVQAAFRERQRPPARLEPHPADGAPHVGKRGLAEHRRRDVSAGHPVSARRQVPGEFPAAAAQVEQFAAGQRQLADGAVQLEQAPGQPAACHVLGWPPGCLGVEQCAHPVRVAGICVAGVCVAGRGAACRARISGWWRVFTHWLFTHWRAAPRGCRRPRRL
jgi:hypothetical protein